MTPEDRQWYDNQFTLFSTDGYKDLMEQVRSIIVSIDTIKGITTEAELKYRQGQLDLANWLLGWQASVEETAKQLEDESI